MKRDVEPPAGADRAVLPGAFERPDDRRADGRDGPAFGLRGVDGLGRGRRDAVGLFEHPVVFDEIHTDRVEGGQADVEGDAPDVDAFGLESAQDFFSEVKARGRRGYRAFLPGKDRLVPVDVLRPRAFVLLGAFDVGRQGGIAGFVEKGADIDPSEIENATALVSGCRHSG